MDVISIYSSKYDVSDLQGSMLVQSFVCPGGQGIISQVPGFLPVQAPAPTITNVQVRVPRGSVWGPGPGRVLRWRLGQVWQESDANEIYRLAQHKLWGFAMI